MPTRRVPLCQPAAQPLSITRAHLNGWLSSTWSVRSADPGPDLASTKTAAPRESRPPSPLKQPTMPHAPFVVPSTPATQHFNTADSMGRITLTILLSFDRFECEIIAERTRDMIALARRRGQWAGGRPILGYDLLHGEHRLFVNPQEAEQVQAIFRLCLEHESVLATVQALNARGCPPTRKSSRIVKRWAE